MTKKQKLSKDEQEKADMEKMQKRVENLFPSKDAIPTSMSIQQAEQLMVRVNELEAKLVQHEQEVAQSSIPDPRPSKPEPAQVPNEKRIWQLRGLSLRAKLPLTVILLMTLAFVVTTSLSVRVARESVTNTLENDLIAQASLQAELIRSYLTWTRSMAIDLAASAEAIAFDETTMLATIYQTLQRNEQIFGSTIAYEPYQFQSNLYYWSPYYSRASDNTIQFAQLGNPEYNYFQWDWYTLPKKENAPVLSPPYFDEGGGNIWMVTWSVPFYDNAGKFKGVATTDISFKQTQEIVRQIEVGKQGYAFLINQDGTVLGIGEQGGQYKVMEETMLVTDSQKAAGWNNMLAAMTDGKSGFMEVTDPQGKPLFVAYEPIGLDTGWYLGLAFPQTELFEPAQQLQTTLILLSILVSMIASVVLFFFTRSITLPIQQLASRAKLFSRGQIDLNQAKPIVIQTHDELEDLGSAFNQMVSELAIAFQNLEDKVADRTHNLELASEIGRIITEKVDNVYVMLSEAVEIIRSRFGLYYTQVYLVDPSGRTLTLRAGTGDVGQKLLSRGHHLIVSSGSLNGRAVSEKKPVIVADTQKSTSFLPNPLLPNTRSEMAVPLLIGDKVLGVLDMQSEFANALNEDNVSAFQILAGQLSVAIQNSTLFAQSEEARRQIEENVRQTTKTGWQDFLNGVERGKKIGYTFDQTKVTVLENVKETQTASTLSVPITITGAAIGAIEIIEEERAWTEREAQIVQAAAEQLAQHIDNLRLLIQAESYRAEAELVSRRLTREGWATYLQTRSTLASGYSYNLNEIKILNPAIENNSVSALTKPIIVHNEAVGELLIHADNINPNEVDEIFSAVATHLSNHIESLRLLEQTELSRIDVQKSQERFELAVRGSDDGMWDWNIAEDTIYYSPRWKSMLGYEEHELTRGFIEWEELIHPEDKDRATKALEDYLAQKTQEYDVELRLKHKDGHYVWIRDRGKALRREDGTPYRMAGAHTDISERKQNEELIAQRANQLETVATVSTTASTVLNPDALLQQVVNLTKSRFGLYHAHVYLLDENWNTLLLAAGAGDVGAQMVKSGHAIDYSAEQSFVARAARTKQAVIVNDVHNEAGFLSNPLLPNTRAEMAIPMIVGDNVLGVFDVQADKVDAFSVEDANIYATLASQVAVALQNARLYQEQSATVVQLRELDRLKSSFLANMSHELRTPLNSILGFTDVMLEGLDGPLTPNMDNDLKLINKNGQHLLHLINDVLDMAKIESGKLNLIIEKFNLHEIFEEVINITSPFASEKKLALKIEAKSDHDVEINADRTRLRQVMINLINNALKFTEKGKVTIRVIREENNVLISVKDTGIGIPPDHLEAVFQEFTQVDSSTTRKAGGTGLGLPISRKLIEMHGGKLWAESNGVEGEGSTFFVFLPIESRAAVSEPVTRKIE